MVMASLLLPAVAGGSSRSQAAILGGGIRGGRELETYKRELQIILYGVRLPSI